MLCEKHRYHTTEKEQQYISGFNNQSIIIE